MTAGLPFARSTASRRSSTVSIRGWTMSSNSWSGNCASSAWTRRFAVAPVASEITCSSTVVIDREGSSAELRGKPEGRVELGIAREAGDAADPVAVDREHHDPVGAERIAGCLLDVRGERRLAVGPRGPEPDQLETAVHRDGGEEAGDLGGADDVHGLGRHRHQRIAGGQRRQAFDVDRLPRLDEPPHQRLLRRLAGRAMHTGEGSLAALALQAVARPLQRAVRRGDAEPEHIGSLTGRPAQDVTEDERRALPRREQLHRCHERQADRLSPLGLRFRGLALEERVRIRLQVAVDRRGLAAAALLDHPQADVRRDPVEPRRELGARLEPTDPPPGAQHRLLERIVGVVDGAEHPVAVRVQPAAQRRRQLHERLLVPRGRGGQKLHGPTLLRHRRRRSQLRPGRWVECSRPPAEDEHPDSVGTRQHAPVLLRADTGHDARNEVEPLLVGDEGRRARERDVDLLLVRVERVRVVVVVRIAVPVWREREDLHAPGGHAQGCARSPRDPAVDPLHLVNGRNGHVRFRGRRHAFSFPSGLVAKYNPRPRPNSSLGGPWPVPGTGHGAWGRSLRHSSCPQRTWPGAGTGPCLPGGGDLRYCAVAGRVPSSTVNVRSLPPRRTLTWISSPGLWASIASRSWSPVSMVVPSTATTTSFARSAARSAGLPARTSSSFAAPSSARLTPRYAWSTLPSWISASATRCAVSPGIAYPMPSLPPDSLR